MEQNIDSKTTSNNDDRYELVAVKVFHKSILKGCKTMVRDDNHQGGGASQLQVHTALESLEREIAVMKIAGEERASCGGFLQDPIQKTAP